MITTTETENFIYTPRTDISSNGPKSGCLTEIVHEQRRINVFFVLPVRPERSFSFPQKLKWL